jgi:L-threonylcarbamoyladenylate synthase
MQDRHYAPRARLLLFDPRDPGAALAECRALGGRCAAVVRSPAPDGVGHAITLPPDPRGYGRELYNALHQLDDAGVDLILVERPPDDPAWDAIRDRLERAARH